MSELAIGRREGAGGTFSPLVVALMLAVGVLGFVGTFVLGAYAPDLNAGRNGGAHALSNAATGYAGLVRLLDETGREPRIIRDVGLLSQTGLVVLTPERGATPIDPAVNPRQFKPTLMVLPKWSVSADRAHRGWVRVTAALPRFEPQGVMAPGHKFTILRRPGRKFTLTTAPGVPAALRLAAPRPVQAIVGYTPPVQEDEDGVKRSYDRLIPLVTDGRGGVVLGRFEGRPFFVLADPDLISNHGIAELPRARAAVALLDYVAGGRAQGVAFDVTLNGLARGRSLLKLAFEPPFLGLTLCIAAALLLVGWRALTRFGAPVRPERAVAFGKRALLDNSAALVRKAGREAAVGRRYADAVRARARDLFGAPPALAGAELDRYLDRLSNGERFGELAAAVERAGDRQGLLEAARRLHGWMEDRIR